MTTNTRMSVSNTRRYRYEVPQHSQHNNIQTRRKSFSHCFMTVMCLSSFIFILQCQGFTHPSSFIVKQYCHSFRRSIETESSQTSYHHQDYLYSSSRFAPLFSTKASSRRKGKRKVITKSPPGFSNHDDHHTDDNTNKMNTPLQHVVDILHHDDIHSPHPHHHNRHHVVNHTPKLNQHTTHVQDQDDYMHLTHARTIITSNSNKNRSSLQQQHISNHQTTHHVPENISLPKSIITPSQQEQHVNDTIPSQSITTSTPPATTATPQPSNNKQQSIQDTAPININNNNNNNNNKNSNKNEKQKNPVTTFLSHILPPPKAKLVSKTPEWKKLTKHASYIQKSTHLRELLKDEERAQTMYAMHDGIYLDYSRQKATLETMDLLHDLADCQNLKEKIDAMVTGEKINFTEDRAVLHTALRAKREDIGTIFVDGIDVVSEVYDVLDQIKFFTEAVRSGKIRGYTGKRLRNIISVGIGGSYLGPEFLHETLKTEPEGINSALGYTLRFLSNVDPVDVERACADLDPEETLIVIVSKTFTTAETMLNARTMRQWLWDFMGNDMEVVKKHVVAVASISSIEKVQAFGIDTENYFFRFWDWVGGRYSVCSAVGGLPISLLYGFDLFEKFLQGARSMDDHFMNAPLRQNIPVIMGLLGVWNMSFLNYPSRTVLPYSEALLKLPAHIQQLDMESNGKQATRSGLKVDYPVGEVDFGEPGTNGQHSFFQLLHMGQVIPCEFIGFLQSQHDLCIDGELLSSHDELMANFFAQPDALANGKTADEVRAEGNPEQLIVHKTFDGNRPSLSILAPKLTAYSTGQLLAMYEHRTAVQGFIWDINSFDQWGVELGKKLAGDVKNHLLKARMKGEEINTGSPATTRILKYYVENSQETPSWDSNPLTSVTRKTHREHFPPSCNDLKGSAGKLL